MIYKIIVDKQPKTNPSNEKKTYTIDIEELRVKGEIYDSLIITKDNDYVMRRLSLSDFGVLSVLAEPIKQPIPDVNIKLFEGDNYIYVADSTGNRFYAEYLVKNDFTDTYVTTNQMTSAINQSAGEIELSVNQKLEGYSTTEEMHSAIDLKANEISSTVSSTYTTKEATQTAKNEAINSANNTTDTKLANYSTTVQMNSAINQKADSITSTVNKKFEDYSTTTQMNTAINQKADSITSSVSQTYATKNQLNDYSTTTQMNSAINQKADSITSSVASTYETKSNASDTYATKTQLSTARSEIKQTTDSISSTVSTKVGNNEVISKINQSSESVTINASKINLSGYLTITSASNTYASKNDLKDGKTTISGNCLTTGTINANSCKITNINADNITSGTIKGRAITNGNNFSVDTSGNMTCSNATCNNINVNKGKIKLDAGSSSNASLQIGNNFYASEGYLSMGEGYWYSNRIEMMASTTDRAEITVSSNGNQTDITGDGITTPTLTQTSREESKKNFEKLSEDKALEIVLNTEIYKYNLKMEEDNAKKHIGFIIGKNYKYSSEITAEQNGEEIGVDNYSMTSATYGAIQKLYKMIQELQEKIGGEDNG